jgi:hypothetical protein
MAARGITCGSYRRDGVAAGNPFVRLFSQAPAVAPARKVAAKLTIVNVSIMRKKTKRRGKGSSRDCPAFSLGSVQGNNPALVVLTGWRA